MALSKDQIELRVSRTISDEEIEPLMERHIEPEPHGFSIADACLKDSGSSVAAIIADLEAEDGNIGQAAEDFRTSTEGILAAVFFYWRNQDVIDAEMTVRRSGFMD